MGFDECGSPFDHLQADLTGGYYDAGYNGKFGLRMAFTATMLAWGVVEFWQELSWAGERSHAIRWATDYRLKAVAGPTELWVQVGDGDSDHNCWERREDMDTSRKASKVDKDHPASEVAAETAAALAAASEVFKHSDQQYSEKLNEKAIWVTCFLIASVCT
ncbi:hypothetical protein Mapa_013690 [Marchantia paleacea]|nr:hypothetical protein Mapa_013690 [Marchantia paleacea]